MPASRVAAAAARGVRAQRCDVGVIVERQPSQAPRGGGQQQHSKRALERRDGDPGSPADVSVAGPDVTIARGSVAEPEIVVGAFGADALRACFDPFDDEPGVGDIARALLTADEIEDPQAEMAAEVSVRLEIGLITHRLWSAEGRQQTEFAELRQGRVDRAAAQFRDQPRRPGVDLVSGEVLGPATGEHAEDRASLGRAAHPAGSQQLPAASGSGSSRSFCPVEEMFEAQVSGHPKSDNVLSRNKSVILRIDRLQTEMPPPSDPDPVGASAVQELLGGKYGEMSTFMNYTYQSFNFRNRQGARPFYDLVASIAAEEFGHIELVSTAINTMLTGATDGKPGELGDLTGVKDTRNTQQFIAGGAATMVQDSMGKPWNGDYVSASGDLIEDLTHNFFLETGARNNKLKVYEMVDHPAARALTGYLLVRGGVHQVAYARALENLTGANLMKLFPSPRIPTDKIPSASRTSSAAST